MAFTITGGPILLISLASVVFGFLKGARVGNLLLFAVFGLLQTAAVGAHLVALVLPFGDLVQPLSSAIYGTAGGAALLLLLVDLGTTFAYVKHAVEDESSLSARSIVLFGILPGAVSFAVLFRLGWSLGEVKMTEIYVGGNDLGAYFGLGGVIGAFVVAMLAACLTVAAAQRDDRGNASKGDYFSKVWFAMFFFFVPAVGVSIGMGGLLGPKEIAGGYLFLQAIVLPVILSNALAMMRDMLKSTIKADRVDNEFF